MASALRAPWVPKSKSTLPSHYHESFLEKKGPRNQDYKKFWAGLQGRTLYFYNSNRDSQHMEKLDLGAFVTLTDEVPWGCSRDPGTHFSLVLRNQEIKFKLRVPSNLTLLPGHLYMMAAALAKEEARRALEMPLCFLMVSRLEAQLLLERYPECGNLLLRPSGDGAGGVSVTMRQMLNGIPMVRHYKFSCASLDAVVTYFVSHTNKALVPFLLDEDYEMVLGYVEANKENGESVWVAPSVPAVPRPVSRQDKLPTPLNEDENYVIPIGDAPTANYVNGDVPSTSRPVGLKPRKLAKLPKPPTVPKPGLADLTVELEEKLQRRRAPEHCTSHAGTSRPHSDRTRHIPQSSSQNSSSSDR
ncbi:hypothetical protein MC885_013657 [Smutsia gigantea]|nr:hypothetical protein MC885_013657 [Smutsia gigantea]